MVQKLGGNERAREATSRAQNRPSRISTPFPPALSLFSYISGELVVVLGSTLAYRATGSTRGSRLVRRLLVCSLPFTYLEPCTMSSLPPFKSPGGNRRVLQSSTVCRHSATTSHAPLTSPAEPTATRRVPVRQHQHQPTATSYAFCSFIP